jgi:exodeoxyribonuclease VII small subunit
MTQAPQSKDIETLSFEHAMKELEEIVRRLESGAQELEQSIKDYARGSALKAHCEKKLAEAKLKVDKIVSGKGALKTEPFDAE